jgi:RNase P subunit RPR2
MTTAERPQDGLKVATVFCSKCQTTTPHTTIKTKEDDDKEYIVTTCGECGNIEKRQHNGRTY